jgi:hypothetical protein
VPVIVEFAVFTAPLTTLDAAIWGVSTTVALITNPDASNPSRAMPRELIDERPFADGLERQRGIRLSHALHIKVKPVRLLKPGYLRKVHELARSALRVAPKAR